MRLQANFYEFGCDPEKVSANFYEFGCDSEKVSEGPGASISSDATNTTTGLKAPRFECDLKDGKQS